MLEKFLTLPQEEFQKLLRDSPSLEQDDGKREAYRYARVCIFSLMHTAIYLTICLCCGMLG